MNYVSGIVYKDCVDTMRSLMSFLRSMNCIRM